MAERKTAFDAIRSDSVDSFINEGLSKNAWGEAKVVPTRTGAAASPTSQPTNSPDSMTIDAARLSRAFCKARIQKSIRFRPELIEQLDERIQQEELKGLETPSIQEIMNRALALWLRENN